MTNGDAKGLADGDVDGKAKDETSGGKDGLIVGPSVGPDKIRANGEA